MATLRYCGEIKIRLTYRDASPARPSAPNGFYVCVLRTESGRKTTVVVGAPAYLSHAVDSPEAFDEAARAALAFAVDDKGDRENNGDAVDWSAFACFDDHGYYVSRSAPEVVT